MRVCRSCKESKDQSHYMRGANGLFLGLCNECRAHSDKHSPSGRHIHAETREYMRLITNKWMTAKDVSDARRTSVTTARSSLKGLVSRGWADTRSIRTGPVLECRFVLNDIGRKMLVEIDKLSLKPASGSAGISDEAQPLRNGNNPFLWKTYKQPVPANWGTDPSTFA